jgi:hypothetical protein
MAKLLDRRKTDNTKQAAAHNLTKDAKLAAKDAAQLAYVNTKDAAQSTYETVKSNLNKTQAIITAGTAAAAAAAGSILHDNLKDSNKKAQEAQKNLKHTQNVAQVSASKSLSRAKDVLQTGISYAQDALSTSTDYAQSTTGYAQKIWKKNAKEASKNLKKAQKNLHNLQDTVSPKIAHTQEALSKGAVQATKNIQHVASSAKDKSEALQEQYAQHQRQRQRAKTLFRIGLVAGILATLLYTPIEGSEVRQRIGEQWNRYRGYLGF